MKMTRQHFKTLATAMKDCKPQYNQGMGSTQYSTMFEQWEFCVSSVMKALNECNPSFNASKFLNAIGMEREDD